MDEQSFDAMMLSLDPAMVVVTTAAGAERAGCLVGFHSQSSIEPRRCAVWLSKANHTYRVALLSPHLAIHMLTDADREVAEVFGSLTGDEVDKFERCAWTPGPHGVPLIDRCRHRLVVQRTTLVDEGGDHVCVMASPVAAEAAGRFTPLRLSDVEDLVPGHDAGERPRPATERSGRTRR